MNPYSELQREIEKKSFGFYDYRGEHHPFKDCRGMAYPGFRTYRGR